MNADFKILIVDDELMIAEMIKEMLLELKYVPIGIAENYDEAMKFLTNRTDIDLAILDINLSEAKSGLDVAKEINEKFGLPFIYLTSYSDPKTIRNAALTTPAAYLLKPFTKSDLFTTIEMIKARKYRSNKSVVVKEGNKDVKIQLKDILYVKSDNNYIELITVHKKYILRNSLDKFLDQIDDSNFIRIHRSYAANIWVVDAINGQYLLIGKEKIPLSRIHRQEFLAQFSGEEGN